MFVVIYRRYLKPGSDDAYQKSWRMVARYFTQCRGAIGSTLHRAPDGLWVAYSRWPDKATRDASWPNPQGTVPEEVLAAIAIMKDCLDEEQPFPEIALEVVDEIFADTANTQDTLCV